MADHVAGRKLPLRHPAENPMFIFMVILNLIILGVLIEFLATASLIPHSLPANVEVVTGDLIVPESLDPALRGVDAVFLVWTASPASAPAVVERLAAHVRRVVFLSSPHQTRHPAIHADGVVRWPYAASETAAVDDRDVAAVAARTLHEDGHAGGDYVLTARSP